MSNVLLVDMPCSLYLRDLLIVKTNSVETAGGVELYGWGQVLVE